MVNNIVYHPHIFYIFLTSIISCILYLIIFFLADLIVKIFNNENNLVLQSITTDGLKLYFIAVIFVGFNNILPMFFSCMEKSPPSSNYFFIKGMNGYNFYGFSTICIIRHNWCVASLPYY